MNGFHEVDKFNVRTCSNELPAGGAVACDYLRSWFEVVNDALKVNSAIGLRHEWPSGERKEPLNCGFKMRYRYFECT
jgi:hypothetical protein